MHPQLDFAEGAVVKEGEEEGEAGGEGIRCKRSETGSRQQNGKAEGKGRGRGGASGAADYDQILHSGG